jgi:DNA-binding MarR family transcriptional regulator
MSTRNREELTAAHLSAVRRLGSQLDGFNQAIAERLGLNATDVQCLSLLGTEGPMSPGQLGEATGLTSGAVTGVIDRLARRGFVRRDSDPDDRRRVIVTPLSEAGSAIERLFEPLRESSRRLLAAYSDDELTFAVDHAERVVGMLRDETGRLREGVEESRPSWGTTSSLAGVTEGTLELVTGASHVTINGEASPDELYRADFGRTVPDVQVAGGLVRVRYRRRWLGASPGRIGLNPTIPWALRLKGGASQVTADLTDLTVRSVDISGGASMAELDLPAPSGVVRIKISGGASQVRLRRPVDSALQVRLRGGANGVRIDNEQLSIGSEAHWESPGAASAPDRYELEISGGANHVNVEQR